MSEKAKAFVDDWIDNNVHATGYQPDGDTAEAQSLMMACLSRAEQEGVTPREIEDAVGSLVDYMSDAIERVNDEEVQRLSAKDD